MRLARPTVRRTTLAAFLVLVALLALLAHFSTGSGSKTKNTINVRLEVSYSGYWNGTYSYGSPCSEGFAKVNWSGHGVSDREISFDGNYDSGIGILVHFQKLDNSSGQLTVSMTSDVFSSYQNSTVAPFGAVDFGACAIS
ncbi:MAG: hypothetical protein HY296_03680 [Thaumarchaeota archaeon]|nr:hypothetical protein [Nitrososphaerota archaeon]